MADPYTKNGRWYVRYKDGFGRWRDRATKTEARRLAAELTAKSDRQRLGLEPLPERTAPLTFGELLDRWWTETEPRLRSKTIRQFTEKHFRAELGPLALAEVDAGRLEALVAAKAGELSPKARNDLRAAAYRVFAWAIRRKLWAGANPAAAVPRLKVPKRLPRYLQPDEVRAVLAVLDRRWRPISRPRSTWGSAAARSSRSGSRTWTSRIARSASAARTTPTRRRAATRTCSRSRTSSRRGSRRRSRCRAPSSSSRPRTASSATPGRSCSTSSAARSAAPASSPATSTSAAGRAASSRSSSRTRTRAAARSATCGSGRRPSRRSSASTTSATRTATLLLKAGVPLVTVQRILRHTDPRITAGTYGHLDLDDMRAGLTRLTLGPSAPRPPEPRRCAPSARARSPSAGPEQVPLSFAAGLLLEVPGRKSRRPRRFGDPEQRRGLQSVGETGFESEGIARR
jgi:integrase